MNTTPSPATHRFDALGTADLPLTASGRIDGRSARKVETQRKIILAASERFAELGYAGASMDDIAEAAQVSKGTIFYNFRNKQELFEQLLHHSCVTVANDIEEARQGLHGWDALVAACWGVMQAADRSPAAAQVLLTELFRVHSPWGASLPELRAIIVAPLEKILAEMAERREQVQGSRALSAEDAPSVATSLLGALTVATLDRRAYTPESDLREVHERLMRSISAVRV